jgi:translation elongation factor P/translation initiation factor 5A
MYRRFATVICRDLRKGTILKREGKYLEILTSLYVQRGVGQGLHVDVMDIQTLKRGKIYLKSDENAETAELDTYQVEVESVDLKHGFLNVSDARSNIINIPLAFASWAKKGAKPGTLLQLITDGEVFVKLSLPLDFKVVRK